VEQIFPKEAEGVELKTAAQRIGSKTGTPGRLEGIANRRNGAALGDLQDRAGHAREEMGMFVGVEMSNGNASVLQFFNLGGSFALDLLFADLPAKERLDEIKK
jgi:hypothetical protein